MLAVVAVAVAVAVAVVAGRSGVVRSLGCSPHHERGRRKIISTRRAEADGRRERREMGELWKRARQKKFDLINMASRPKGTTRTKSHDAYSNPTQPDPTRP